MVSLEDAVVARYEKKGIHFEILVDPKAAEDFLDGRDINLSENLATDLVFKDANKGTKASEESISEVFGTTDINSIAKIIVKEGKIQLTTSQRREMQERKKKKIIDTIARNSMNPQTKLPHPKDRIELAIEEAGVHIDPFKPVDVQIKDIINAIRPIIPISIENVEIEVKIQGKYAGRAYGEVKSFGTILKEEWLPDGSWKCRIEIPAGMQTEFYDKLNNMTKGDVETKICK
ncbi:MAG: ribosome assembly factor SBDS [Candidatus Thermoplasmatota archaeon]|nr:ribosome assembly factor SBDS [Candidatus Thermoplasmatota archaeon]